MTKFPEAINRLFNNVFVCRVCKAKIRSDPLKVRKGQVLCRHCKSRVLRPKNKERKGASGKK